MKRDAERPHKTRGAWITPVFVAIIGGAATVAAAYIGNRGGFTEILPGSPVKTVTLAPSTVAQSEQSTSSNTGSSTSGGKYLYTLTPVENTTNANIITGPVQMGNSSYPNSVSTLCYSEPEGSTAELAYDVNGAKFLDTTVGVPNDAADAAGNSITITFFKNGPSDQIGAPVNVSVGQSVPIHLNLQGASQLDISCAAINNATHQGVDLNFALGRAQLTS
jgi:hypothetical protein